MENITEKVIGGYRLSGQEALDIMNELPTDGLCMIANRLRQHFHGNHFDTCSIINARSGRCSENCKWCSQSVFHKTDIDTYPLVSTQATVDLARHNQSKGVKRFSIVTSGRTVSKTETAKIVDMLKALREETNMAICASLGLLDKDQLIEMYDAGLGRYHCNLETAPSYFNELCTTHTTQEKIRTIKWAQELGMAICSGGIIGMGETMEHRIELALKLRELNVDSMPFNVLNPIKGTALEGAEPLSDDEILRSAAIFKIIHPTATVRLAGGQILIKHLKERLLRGGVSAAIVGDMLTTTGQDIETDKALFKKAGFEI